MIIQSNADDPTAAMNNTGNMIVKPTKVYGGKIFASRCNPGMVSLISG